MTALKCYFQTVLLLIASLFMTESTLAENVSEMITDRPDQANSPFTVLPRVLQVEAGLLYTEDYEGDERSRILAVPQTLIRTGLSDRIELRLTFDGYISEDVEGEDGVGDSAIGLKINLLKESGIWPETGFLANLTLPTGEDAFSSEREDPSFQFLFSHTLTDRITLGYNLGMTWETVEERSGGGHDTLSSFQYAVVVGFGITKRLAAYVESFGSVQMSAEGNPAHSFDTGFTYKVRNNLQLDTSAGIGLSDGADDWFGSAGISFATPF
ncbi:MAG: transporter [Candidatus Scalindua sp. AMX11]|nr:MAG: transporter [Candidatus Scalindua sp.]NOG84293.1 transporter [Planctomycetota bacterium]RZV67162.1 MAG: transporter [Candidatus Scalindua sp. SCAELEC01]TDE63663.1 MAG: transporter [Candidatus Scalindua sp. AMX11]GJQ60792.1 MAG: hypothetical protein SCALA701_35930 [Candidatus Scalindua sp.]